ncbi:MAG TPA: hypothetical protein VF414_14430, partial [Thermoanaerobaculia bacterium]
MRRKLETACGPFSVAGCRAANGGRQDTDAACHPTNAVRHAATAARRPADADAEKLLRRAAPRKFYGTPQKFYATPRKFSGTPRKFPGVPQKFYGSLRRPLLAVIRNDVRQEIRLLNPGRVFLRCHTEELVQGKSRLALVPEIDEIVDLGGPSLAPQAEIDERRFPDLRHRVASPL